MNPLNARKITPKNQKVKIVQNLTKYFMEKSLKVSG